jgi:hypothetical protein
LYFLTACSVALGVIGCILISSPEDFEPQPAPPPATIEEKKAEKEEIPTQLPSETKSSPVIQALKGAAFLNLFFLLMVTNCTTSVYG